MADKFFFVDGIHPDKASKRLMRRHVMKGKNAGKTFHRPSRLGVARRQPHFTYPTASFRVSSHPRDWIRVSPYTISGTLGGAIFTFTLPVEVTPYSIKVINEFYAFTAERIYPSRLGISLDSAKCMWLRVMFSDEASYHCNIALMHASNELFLGNGNSSPKALHYLSQTFSQVKKRLESKEALSDSTIGIVLSLIQQELIRREYLGAKIHFDGLTKMIELRGGLDQLEGNLPLVLKVCKTDIIFTIQYGGPTKFFRDRMATVREVLASKGLSFDRTSATSLVWHDELDPYLHKTLLDIINASLLFNNTSCAREVDLVTFQEMLISICFRLLRFRQLDDLRRRSDIQSVYHIGLTVFMMTIFLQYDRRKIMNHKLISTCLREALDSRSAEHDEELLLWFMIVGGIWISGDVDGDWIAPRIWNTAQQLGIRTWEEALTSITKLPWINVLHDEPGRALWDLALQGH